MASIEVIAAHAAVGAAGGVVQVIRDGRVELPSIQEDGVLTLNEGSKVALGIIGGGVVGAAVPEAGLHTYGTALGLGLGVIQIKDILQSLMRRKDDRD